MTKVKRIMKFLDICSGIGGFRNGLEKAGHKCVGYIEIDKYARKSYEEMYDTKGEWTAFDIRDVRPEEIPKSDIWCFGFPCQDISVAGKQKGLAGDRSGIFYDILKLLKSKRAEDRPKWLLIENVKNLFSIDKGEGFTEVLSEISEAGYDAEWHLINSKDHGVPQNRERVFIIGHLRGDSGRQILPLSGTSEQTGSKGQAEQKTNTLVNAYRQNKRIYGVDGIGRCLTSAEGGGIGNGVRTGLYAVPKIEKILGSTQHFSVMDYVGISPTLAACDYKDPQKIAIPCLTPDRPNKRQNGRRFKEPNDPMFTLTVQDRHGVLIYDDDEYYIRRLTPKECFRLQGFTDELFEKAKEVNSNSQLYKQAGNAVTVNVAYVLGLCLKETEQ